MRLVTGPPHPDRAVKTARLRRRVRSGGLAFGVACDQAARLRRRVRSGGSPSASRAVCVIRARVLPASPSSSRRLKSLAQAQIPGLARGASPRPPKSPAQSQTELWPSPASRALASRSRASSCPGAMPVVPQRSRPPSPSPRPRSSLTLAAPPAPDRTRPPPARSAADRTLCGRPHPTAPDRTPRTLCGRPPPPALSAAVPHPRPYPHSRPCLPAPARASSSTLPSSPVPRLVRGPAFQPLPAPCLVLVGLVLVAGLSDLLARLGRGGASTRGDPCASVPESLAGMHKAPVRDAGRGLVVVLCGA
ncbi:hypothetical protein DFR72_115147 [Lentzea flaviverrucosa]|uniref:Uncharacterized protein n=1 Tax=Lentzea flaviverrucosa TaxID=200379 RepID=A0A1H9XJU1_9PSEU|nr:hypothetical protein DFR72_115147 [Lentzea flaviverrucosa]SES46468.1 hypothetical protein SAMN05216195_115147 [Lentzea flaviverrucosa]